MAKGKAASRPRLSSVASRLRAPSSWPAWSFAAALVLTQLLGRHIVLSQLNGDGVRNHLSPVSVMDVVLPLILVPLVALGILALEELARRPLSRRCAYAPTASPRALFALYAAMMMLAWTPWLLAFYPGGLPLDTITAVSQHAGSWDNKQPIVFTLVAKAFIGAGTAVGNPDAGLFAYALVQSLAMSAVLAYGVLMLARRGAPKWFCWSAIAFFSLAASIPAFAISMAKDVPFSLAVVGLTYLLVTVVESDGRILSTPKGLGIFAALALCIMFTRNNGLFVVAGTVGILILMYRAKAVKFAAVGVGLVVAVMLIQGPGFALLGVSNTTSTVESLGPELQQVAYISASQGQFTEAQRNTFDRILPRSLWSALYDSEVVDPIKSNDAFDGKYLSSHLPEFLAAWAGVVAKNPVLAAQAYTLGTYGYWKASDDHPNWAPWIEVNDLGIRGANVVPPRITLAMFNVFAHTPRRGGGFPSEGLFFWVLASSLAILALQRRWQVMLVAVPCLLLWLTVMLASPTAYGLRYVLPLALCAPIFIFLPFYRSRLD